MAVTSSVADSIDFVALLLALHETDKNVTTTDVLTHTTPSNTVSDPVSSTTAVYIGDSNLQMGDCEDDVTLALQFEKEWKTLTASCSINTPLATSPDQSPISLDTNNINEVVQIIEHIKLNTTGKKCRCWIEPAEWLHLTKHKFVQKVVKPVLCSVCFEPKTSGYAKLTYPIVPQQWILNNVVKSSYFFSLIYAAYVYNAYDKLFMALGSSAMMAAYNKLVTKRRRKNQQYIINKRDSPIKQGELICEHYIAPLVRIVDVKVSTSSCCSTLVRDINTPLSPPDDFRSVLMSSTAIQNEVYSLPDGEAIKKVIDNPSPCYISQICKEI